MQEEEYGQDIDFTYGCWIIYMSYNWKYTQHRFAISWTVALSLGKLSAMNLLLGAVNDEGRSFVVK